MTGRTTGSRTADDGSGEVPLSSFNRRTLLAGAVSAISATLLDKGSAHSTQTNSAVPTPATLDDPGKVQGHIPTELGERSPFEHPRRRINRPAPAGESETPLQDLFGTITPADLHFERHHAGMPATDREKSPLLIHGMVALPHKFTHAKLRLFPAVSPVCFIECSGN